KNKIVSHIIDEQKVLLSFLTKKNLLEKKSINSPNNVNISKLQQLEAAKEAGLNTPDSYIISTKRELEQLLKTYTKVATKPLSEMLFLDGTPQDYGTYTELITIEELPSFSDFFYPIFVQSYIDKLIEIRSFYLMGDFYSMAMFTQRDTQTTIDFRRYNFEKPTRSVPFKLPVTIEKKLTRLMRKLNLNCGSFDILFDKNYKFHFLEVNPVGQFGMVSIPCNYYLEKQIAETLQH
ncbi:MAG TPA: grasp-with-spasm system ATP-grasp peptide maturase, partial [Emticicia sp.]